MNKLTLNRKTTSKQEPTLIKIQNICFRINSTKRRPLDANQKPPKSAEIIKSMNKTIYLMSRQMHNVFGVVLEEVFFSRALLPIEARAYCLATLATGVH